MAQTRRRRTRRQGGAGRALPGWAMLTIGLIIGLFVAFLVYLEELDQPPNATVQAVPTEPPDAADQPGTDGDPADGEATGPRFEFYSILPELEVVVPEFDSEDDADEGAGDRSATGVETNKPAPEGGRFFLQAGSFRKAAQADRMKAEIALLGLDVAIQDVRINGEQWHRVRVGPYAAARALKAAQSRLRDHEIDYLVMREKASE